MLILNANPTIKTSELLYIVQRGWYKKQHVKEDNLLIVKKETS
jgi:hypothetical protein